MDFAISNGSTIVNVIVADSKEIAEQATGMTAIATTPYGVWLGWKLHGDTWRPPMPTEGMWTWDESTLSWVEVTA